jgi:hypothetical protein
MKLIFLKYIKNLFTLEVGIVELEVGFKLSLE